MSVYFVYRCPLDNPGGKFTRRFDADTVLDWFRSIWHPVPDSFVSPGPPERRSWDYAKELIGRELFSFPGLFDEPVHGAPPTTMAELAAILESAMYLNEIHHGPHHIEILTDDDELDMAVYIFDDVYLAEHPERAAFLAREDWRLPETAIDGEFLPAIPVQTLSPAGPSIGQTYFVCTYHMDAGSLGDLAECADCHGRFEGVRLPDFAGLLLGLPPDTQWATIAEMPELLDRVREVVAAATGDEAAFLRHLSEAWDAAGWAAYSDWLVERGEKPAGVRLLELAFARPGPRSDTDPAKCKWRVHEHVAQFCSHRGKYRESEEYWHWVLFDDLWAAANPDLANSLLRYSSRWDCL